MSGEEPEFVIRLRGLPWSAKASEVIGFMHDVNIEGGEEGVHFTFSRDGRPSGECFAVLETEDDLNKALEHNNKHMGKRYIEIFRCKAEEMEWMLNRAGVGAAQNQEKQAVLKLRGLPYGCSKEEISQFFSGFRIIANGITLPEDHQGRSTGEAFVEFATPEIAEKAMQKHKDRIGHRYIEIFKSSADEIYQFKGPRPLMGTGMQMRPGPYDRGDRYGLGMMNVMSGYARGRGGRNVKGMTGFEEDYDDFGFRGGMGFGMRPRRGGPGMGPMRGGRGGGMDRRGGNASVNSKTGHSVHMRGLPFEAIDQDVFDFFSPIQPVACRILYSDNGRSTGEADVDFACHQEALEAMKKNKCNMNHRYIELFLNSTQSNRNLNGGGGGGSSSSGGYGNRDGGFGGNMSAGNFSDDYVSGFGSGGGGGAGGIGNSSSFGGYGGGAANQSFGGNQGFGNQSGGFGSGGGFGNQGGMNYDMGGGGYGDGGMGSGGGMMGNNYTSF